MTTATPTRQRLVDSAIRLFSTQGFDATRVAQIEASAGLAAGSGALYHYYPSKEALLEECITRQLDRRTAMRDLRALFAGLDDLHAELTMMGRYLDTVFTAETELLQIAARTPPGRSTRLDTAYTALIGTLTAELADWIAAWAPALEPQRIQLLAKLGVNALQGTHTATHLYHQPSAPQSNDYLSEWTALLATRIETLTATTD